MGVYFLDPCQTINCNQVQVTNLYKLKVQIVNCFQNVKLSNSTGVMKTVPPEAVRVAWSWLSLPDARVRRF